MGQGRIALSVPSVAYTRAELTSLPHPHKACAEKQKGNLQVWKHTEVRQTRESSHQHPKCVSQGTLQNICSTPAALRPWRRSELNTEGLARNTAGLYSSVAGRIFLIAG